ncbi:MAG: DMT family transporter [Pseudomonadota bacterium]
MVMLTFTWGVGQVAAKVSTEGFSPVFLTMARSAIGLLVILLWCAVRRISLFERDGTLGAGFLAGALFGLEFVLIFLGLNFTTAARATLMINTMPFFVLIGAHFVLGERITLRRLSGVGLAFLGVGLVLSDDLSAPGDGVLIGDLLCLAGGAAWAATTLVIKGSRLSQVRGEKTLAYQLAISALVMVPFLPLAGPMLRELSALATGALLFQGILVVGVTYLIWFTMIRTYSATGLSSFAFLSPVFGVLAGGILLGEPLSIRIFGALVLIAVGLVLVNRTGRRRQPSRSG